MAVRSLPAGQRSCLLTEWHAWDVEPERASHLDIWNLGIVDHRHFHDTVQTL